MEEYLELLVKECFGKPRDFLAKGTPRNPFGGVQRKMLRGISGILGWNLYQLIEWSCRNPWRFLGKIRDKKFGICEYLGTPGRLLPIF